MILPNNKNVYGSASTIVSALNRYSSTVFEYCSTMEKYSQVLYIRRTHIKAIDQPFQRCNQKNINTNTSACIAKFLERKLGCNPMILGSQFSKTPKCSTKVQLMALANASKLFENADENDIYKMTGCLSPCIKDKFSLKLDPRKAIIVRKPKFRCQVHLELIMLDSSYNEEEQYIIYDVNSFIADVGGYMGLLLGSSFLSLYMAMETILKKLFCGPLGAKTEA